MFRSEVERQVRNNSTNQKLKIPVTLTREQQNRLCESYREYHLIFEPTTAGTPAVAHASRIIEIEKLLKMCNYKPLNKETQIIDVGGNFVTHIKRGRSGIHCCCPPIDANDGRRYGERLAELLKLNIRNYAQCSVLESYATLQEKTNKPLCINYAQDCRIQAHRCLFIDSTYI